MYMQVKIKLHEMKKASSPLDLTGTGYCASLNFRRTARAVTRLYDLALQETGVRSTQFAILVGIAKMQPISIGALGNMLSIDSTTLTRSLRLLENEGLIAISKRAAKRQRFLSVTDKGEQTLARSVPAWRAAQERFVATIGSEYWVALRSELERLAHVAIDLERPENSPEQSRTFSS
jgi:DNA-binding MarR family transcriptional regulator